MYVHVWYLHIWTTSILTSSKENSRDEFAQASLFEAFFVNSCSSLNAVAESTRQKCTFKNCFMCRAPCYERKLFSNMCLFPYMYFIFMYRRLCMKAFYCINLEKNVKFREVFKSKLTTNLLFCHTMFLCSRVREGLATTKKKTLFLWYFSKMT
jgi:hypothetical protein